MIRYFRVFSRLLQKQGWKVLQPDVSPVGSIASRAEALREMLINQAGGAPLHLLAHSMGGLDARHLITHRSEGLDIRSLTTLGTPHRGSGVADAVIRSGTVRRILPILERGERDLGGLKALTTEACAEFNDTTPDVPGVRYYSVAGAVAPARIRVPLRLSCCLLQEAEGDNDGLVSVASADWGERIAVLDADHLDLIGWGPLGSLPRKLKEQQTKLLTMILGAIG